MADRAGEINRRGVEISRRPRPTAGTRLRVDGADGQDAGGRRGRRPTRPDAFTAPGRGAGRRRGRRAPVRDLQRRRGGPPGRPGRIDRPAGGRLVRVRQRQEQGPDHDGGHARAVGRAMAEEGADAVGANCGAGPEAFPPICRRLKAASGLPVWIKPNAGMPEMEGGQAVYTHDARGLRRHPARAWSRPGRRSSAAAAEPARRSSARWRGPPCHASSS